MFLKRRKQKKLRTEMDGLMTRAATDPALCEVLAAGIKEQTGVDTLPGESLWAYGGRASGMTAEAFQRSVEWSVTGMDRGEASAALIEAMEGKA